MLDWMKHKLESRLPGETSITSDTQTTSLLWKKAEKNFMMIVKEESEKLNIQKMKIMTSGPSLHGKQMGKQWKQ